MLGAELRRVREEKGLSLEEAARAVGIERVNILRQLEEGHGAKVFFKLKKASGESQAPLFIQEDIDSRMKTDIFLAKPLIIKKLDYV